MTAPLVTIHFEDGDDPRLVIERHWYHVPQVGELVELHHNGETVGGTVRAVFWDDNGDVTVRL